MKGETTYSSSLISDPLHQDFCSSSLEVLSKVIQTCLGPRAKLKLLRHEEGGSAILTSSFRRLFHHLSVKNIFTKIVISTAKCQLKNFKAYLALVPPPSRILDDYNINMLNFEGAGVKESKLFRGILVPVSKIDANCFSNRNNKTGPYRLALFSTSLAGDADFPVKALEISGSFTALEIGLKHLEIIANKLILEKVHFVFCQKVIHPKVRKKLQKVGIFVLDRLGTEITKLIQFISGGCANASLVSDISYASLATCVVEQVGRKFYLRLEGGDVPFFTLVLGHCNAQAAAELQVVCGQAFSALFRILRSGKVCSGAGCAEIYTAHIWAAKVKEQSETIRDEVGCTLGQMRGASTAFLRSVTDACVAVHQGARLDFVTEHTHGHMWRAEEGQFPKQDDRCACARFCASGVDSGLFFRTSGFAGSTPGRPKTANLPIC
ncbi:hypothetical protein CEXT_676311 [Caerostris extrusa]|uniref:Uncharacterized protein n=1 Tax=Caerostris extrusa TaxID=172846 RepID=A0AAV4WRP2_CAEEX|nr:hypothetical protein CEXT_676311 [Caerostris extrusa]